MFIKIVFFQFTATHLLHVDEADEELICARDLSLQQGGGIRGEIIVLARRLELKHDATEVELPSTVSFF